MRTLSGWIALGFLLLAVSGTAGAADMRDVAQRAEMDRQRAERAAREAEAKILEDRQALLEAVRRLEGDQRRCEENLEHLKRQKAALEKTFGELTAAWSEREMQFRETVGNVRTVARDLEGVLKHSMTTGFQPERLERLRPLLEKNRFPGVEDITLLGNLFFEEIEASGEVSLRQAGFVNRAGEDRLGEVLTLGKFTAIYRDGEEVGFLQYSDATTRFHAFPEPPPWRVRRNLKAYLAGKAEAVYLDMSGGGAIRQIIQKPGLWEQILNGGPIVWPILAIALLALVLVAERTLYLNRVHGNTDRFMVKINQWAGEGRWDKCEELVGTHREKGWPVINVLTAGLAGRHEDRQTLESILQEAILREVPRLERSLAVLAILGAIAPLLGLLGTVTGMIDTFRVITLYGTGDPRMMSGGISEALVTTELGLAAAIPIMLFHTFLSRRVDQIVGEMEEKAVALSNSVYKEHCRDGAHE